MSHRLPEPLEEKVRTRLLFYEDVGIELFYRDRHAPETASVAEENLLPKSVQQAQFEKLSTLHGAPPPLKPGALPALAGASLFEAINKMEGDTLLRIRADIGDCTRCKLHRGRTKLVFGDGNPDAQLVFVGEGPGRDEDAQGLPFVGRAGKLLTQMIEAMGLRRQDVYICNVVKCRPPENRTPEKDEVETCSPFLLRQLDVISPKVIVCLGAVAAQTLLETNRGISHFRGQWLEFRGRKLMATYHPAYLLRNPSAKSEVWKDLQKVMSVLGLTSKKGSQAGKSS
ncbi:MAG TPA: uracil-DNA glycosylase [Candidatus Acidoferrum sp.]|nr:uracil-DNA glycosylase [Candidatus Acidoferrum sp.]